MKEKTYILKGHVTTDATEIKRIIRDQYEEFFVCVHIQFYCNKATCTLLTFKTEHHLSFPVKQKEKFKNKQEQNYNRECQLQIRC